MHKHEKAAIVVQAAKAMLDEGCSPAEAKIMRDIIGLPVNSQATLYNAMQHAQRIVGASK